jgi:hypothetical protein
MTRKQVIEGYGPINERGVFASPGKFEGENAYVAIAYDAMLNGFADEHEDGSFSVEVEATDRQEFPELGHKRRIRCIETDQGFVCEC